MSPASPPTGSTRRLATPIAAPAPPIDNTRTTLVVRLGLIVLALVGVISVFGEPLLGIGAASPDLAGPPGASEPTDSPAAAKTPSPR